MNKIWQTDSCDTVARIDVEVWKRFYLLLTELPDKEWFADKLHKAIELAKAMPRIE